ncbi:MAG: VPLPA-CTERM sorting domain-containing protein, partial [Gammaproteobacteria bacterium]
AAPVTWYIQDGSISSCYLPLQEPFGPSPRCGVGRLRGSLAYDASTGEFSSINIRGNFQRLGPQPSIFPIPYISNRYSFEYDDSAIVSPPFLSNPDDLVLSGDIMDRKTLELEPQTMEFNFSSFPQARFPTLEFSLLHDWSNPFPEAIEAGSDYAVWTEGEATLSRVPVPAAVWLFGSALAGLGWLRRRQPD